METLCTDIAMKVGKSEFRDDKEYKETVKIVEKSLQKLLPGFLDRLTKETVANVQKMLKEDPW